MKRYISLKESKEIRVGVLITNNQEILICHATRTRHFDIPKGHQELGENNLDCAIRELREETGLTFPKTDFIQLGSFNYQGSNDLILYKIETDMSKIRPSALRCTTNFVDKNNNNYPEMDGYKIIAIRDIGNYCGKNLVRVIREIFNEAV
jgi:predicted NUDIX family NTP pyrophosphohydrolase